MPAAASMHKKTYLISWIFDCNSVRSLHLVSYSCGSTSDVNIHHIGLSLSAPLDHFSARPYSIVLAIVCTSYDTHYIIITKPLGATTFELSSAIISNQSQQHTTDWPLRPPNLLNIHSPKIETLKCSPRPASPVSSSAGLPISGQNSTSPPTLVSLVLTVAKPLVQLPHTRKVRTRRTTQRRLIRGTRGIIASIEGGKRKRDIVLKLLVCI